jgi:hypothetical protein
LALHLHRIRACEAVVAPASAVFIHLLGMDGKPIETLTERLRSEWGERVTSIPLDDVRDLRAEIGASDADTGTRWIAIAESAATGDYAAFVRLLLEQNHAVMAARGSAAWAEIRDGKLHVRFHEEEGVLPSRSELETMWRFSYFLDSLRSVTAQLGEPS